MAIPDILLQLVYRFWDILSAPVKNPDMLWIIVPIYLNWIFTDYYQERKGTDFGNAITNGVVTLWVGVDWIRQAIKGAVFNVTLASKIGISVFFIIYGLTIMIMSAKAKKIAHYIGRIREVSYVAIVLTPIFYGVISINWTTIGAVLLFFPIWYGIAEIFNRLLPAPKSEEEQFGSMNKGKDIGMADLGSSQMPDMSMGMPQQSFGQQGYGQQGYPQNSGQMPKF
ncbi:MAG: hypothetical protein V1839_03340 [archaeon]